ncbi:hypothetical protein [Streptomyces sp. NPDC003077]
MDHDADLAWLRYLGGTYEWQARGTMLRLASAVERARAGCGVAR